MAQTSSQELQHLMREITLSMNENLPEDLGFIIILFHKGDGEVAWGKRGEMSKVRETLRSWLDRADRMVTDAN